MGRGEAYQVINTLLVQGSARAIAIGSDALLAVAIMGKSPCPPLLRLLPECVLTMVMDYHARAPGGISNGVCYAVGLSGVPTKALIDAIVVHMDSFQTCEKVMKLNPPLRFRMLTLQLRRTAAALASLEQSVSSLTCLSTAGGANAA